MPVSLLVPSFSSVLSLTLLPTALQPSARVVGKESSVGSVVKEGLAFLSTRQEFWRQQKPPVNDEVNTARKRGANSPYTGRGSLYRGPTSAREQGTGSAPNSTIPQAPATERLATKRKCVCVFVFC